MKSIYSYFNQTRSLPALKIIVAYSLQILSFSSFKIILWSL